MHKFSNFNVHLSVFLKPFIGITLIFLFIKNWYLYFFIILLFLFYVLLSRGEFSIKYNKFKYESLFKKIELSSPITYRSWWNYEFKRPYIGWELGTPKLKSRENHVHVFLELKDINEQTLLLHEKIIFGSRFPNETIYSPTTISKSTTVIKCQRLDNVLRILEAQSNDHYKRLKI